MGDIEAVKAGEWVLLRLADGTERLVQVHATGYGVDLDVLFVIGILKECGCHRTVALGKYGKVPSEQLLGRPYGHAYELVDRDKRLVAVPPEEADASFAL